MEHTCSNFNGSIGCEPCFTELSEEKKALELQIEELKKWEDNLTKKHNELVLELRESNRLNREVMEAFEQLYLEYSDDMGCDCGTDEPGSCVYCRAKAVLGYDKPKCEGCGGTGVWEREKMVCPICKGKPIEKREVLVKNTEFFVENEVPKNWDESPKGCWEQHPLTREICQLRPEDGHTVHKRLDRARSLLCWKSESK